MKTNITTATALPPAVLSPVAANIARVNVNLELSRSGNGVRNGFRRPDGRGSGQFAESALDTLYVARNRG
jgi:hypothetical protein